MSDIISSTATNLRRYVAQYRAEIIQQLRQRLVTETLCRAVQTDHTWVSPTSSHGEVVQAYQTAHTPKGAIQFQEVKNELKRMKMDLLWDADFLGQLWDSWMSEWIELGKPMAEWSFVRYIVEREIYPQFEEDMELKVAYHGVFAPPTSGTAGNAINACDGFGKKIADAITNSQLPTANVISIGAIVDNTAAAQIEEFAKSMPQLLKNSTGAVWCAPEVAEKYLFDCRERFGRNMDYTPNTSYAIFGTNKRLTPLPSMTGSNRLFFSTDGNRIVGKRRGEGLIPTLRFQEFDRTVKGLSEYSRFYGVEDWRKVVVSDVA